MRGVDADGDGRLEGDEILESSLLCRGAPDQDGAGGQPGGQPGSGGLPGMDGSGGSPSRDGSGGLSGTGGFSEMDDPRLVVRTSREPMGNNCARGGERLEMGVDDGLPGGIAENGELEDEEVNPDQTRYVCNACIDLAVVGGNGSLLNEVAQGILLQAPGVFCGADLFNVETDNLHVDILEKDEAMLIFNSNFNPFSDPGGVGSDVAAFFDDGGQVVVALFADAGYPIAGAWTAKEYNRLTHEWANLVQDSFTRSEPTQGLFPDHPVLDGVNLLTGSGWIGPNVVMSGATAIAAYAGGNLLAAAGPVTDEQGRVRNRVDLNIHPEDIVTGAWYGDGLQLLANALAYH